MSKVTRKTALEHTEKGTRLTELNNYGMEVVISGYEAQKESLCHTRRDSMLMEPFTISSSRESQSTRSYDIRDL